MKKLSKYSTPVIVLLLALALVSLWLLRCSSNKFLVSWVQDQRDVIISTKLQEGEGQFMVMNIFYKGMPSSRESSELKADAHQQTFDGAGSTKLGTVYLEAENDRGMPSSRESSELQADAHQQTFDGAVSTKLGTVYLEADLDRAADAVDPGEAKVAEVNRDSWKIGNDVKRGRSGAGQKLGMDKESLQQLPKVGAPGVELPSGRFCLTGRATRNILIPCRPEVQLGPRVLPPETSIIETDVMPAVLNLFPEISNGHVATVVQSNSIFMNGLYNGVSVSSHRARIPSTAAVMVTVVSPAHSITGKFRLDLGRGVFSEIYTGDGFTVEVRRYAHRDLIRLLVTEVIVNRTSFDDPITLSLNVNTGPNSNDIDFSMTEGLWTGNTNQPEYAFVNGTIPVYVAYTVVPQNITFPQSSQGSVAFFTSVSAKWADALQYYNRGVSRLSEGTLFSSHAELWDNLWQKGRLEMAGNDSMALSTNAALYYLLSALPLQPDKKWPFVGMSPGGLAHGAAGKDYNGHVFWDQDTWMFPPLMLLHADLGAIIVSTRLRTHTTARLYAAMSGLAGARYPWESAFTGLNVSPSQGTTKYELHVTGDTSLMMRQFIQLTNNTNFLQNEGGYSVISDIADFFVSRSVFDNSLNQYVINGVMGPDEYHSPVNNSVYTNALAALSMRTAQYAAQLVKQTPKTAWDKLASNINIQYDSQYQYHPEFSNYTRGTVVKQADVILLGHPVGWPLSHTDQYNDLTYYATVTPSGPAMTWGIFAVNWLRLGEKANADEAFYKGTWNEQNPFKVWSENADGSGAYNFHTGMGGYLQSLLFGYAGFNLDNHFLTLNPQLPPSLTWMAVRGVDYLGSTFDLTYSASQMNLTLTQAGSVPLSLTLIEDKKTYNLLVGSAISGACQPATIQPRSN